MMQQIEFRPSENGYGNLRYLHVAMIAILAGILGGPVFAATTTTTTLAVSSPTTTAQHPVTLVATVKANGTAVNPGQVIFCNASAPHCEDTSLVGLAQLTANGTATLRLLLPPGKHTFYAKFLGTKGTTAFTASDSVVNPLAVEVSGGQNPVDAQILTAGTAAHRTLSATIDVGAAPASGTVSFKDVATNQVIASAPLGSTSKFSLDGGLFYPVNVSNSLSIVDPDGFFGVEPFAGDFNGDGVPDVLNVNGSEIVVSPGNPAHPGNFLPALYTTYNSDPAYINVGAAEVGDFNGDGVLDVVVATSNHLTVSRGDVSHPGQFLPGKTYSLPANTQYNDAKYICVGDFNGDGLPDVAVSFYVSAPGFSAPNFAVLLNDASNPGHLLAPQSYTEENFAPLSIATADFDGDGILDIAIAGFTEHDDTSLGAQLSLFRGDPANPGKFLAPTTVDAGKYQIQSFRVGDFNGDGLPDMIVASNNILGREESGPPQHNQMNLLLNDTSHPGSFLAPKVYSQQPFGGPINLATGDFNGDGLLDVALSGDSTKTEGLMIYLNDPANRGVFLSPVLYSNNFPILGKNLLDLNGDGLTDVDWVGGGISFPGQNQYNTGFDVQLARRTEVASASNISTGTTSYAYADYAGDSTYGSIASCEVPLDMTVSTPVISSPTVSNLTKTSATISWTSNVATYGDVYYQVNSQLDPGVNYLPQATRWDPSEVTAHSFVLANLTPGTPYVYDIQSLAYFSGCNHYTASFSGTFTTVTP